jgi:hypothetical protein
MEGGDAVYMGRRGRFVTGPAVGAAVTATAALLAAGEGRAVRLLVTFSPVTTLDPETAVGIGPDADPFSFPLAILTVQSPFAVLRYEDFGDVIRLPMNARANVASAAVAIRAVRFHPDGE